MNAKHSIDMAKATRLTRQGRLTEAMAVLRGEDRRADPSTAAETSGTQSRPPSPIAALVDRVRAAMRKGADALPSASPRAGLAQPALPEALRGLFSRGGSLGLGNGLDTGLMRPPVHLPPLPEGARFEERQFANGAGSRAYKIYIPSGYAGEAVPLVVMLHGCTQSPDDFAVGTNMNALAEEETFLVAYPEQAQSANPSRCWNWFNAADQQRDRGEPSLIAGITQEIMQEFNVDAGRVYVAGLSAGGAAAAIMGAVYPDLYAAIGVHSGLARGAATDIRSAFAAMRQGGGPRVSGGKHLLPTIVFHGDRDTTVNPVNGDQVIAQARAGSELSASVTQGRAPDGLAYTRTVESDASGHPMLEHWVLHDAAHAWSGGNPSGSYTEPRGPDASREMLRFFSEHAKAAARIPN